MTGKKRKVPQWKKLAAGLAVTITAGAGSVGVYKNMPYFIGEKVERVIDGDTFILQNNQSVKLLGLDAPEPDNCYGRQSKEFLRKLIEGKRIFLREPITDQYRRIVALVYLDKKLVNEMLVKEGYALFTRSAESATPDLQTANKFARENSLGIFSQNCYQLNPPDPKCRIKGNLDRDKKAWVYLLPTCAYYDITVIEKFQGERWFCSEKEAQEAGFTKFSYCD